MTESNLRFENRIFYWSIKNFDMLPLAPEKAICSPKFSFDSIGFTKFYLALYPRAFKEGDKDQYVSLYLVRHKLDCGPKYVFLQFEIAVTDSDWVSTEYSYTFTKKFEKGTIYGRRDFIGKNALLKRKSASDELFLKCEYALDDGDGENYSPWICDASDFESLSADFLQALQREQHWDLNLRSSEGNLHKVHKAVVATRFPSLFPTLNSEAIANEKFELCTDSSTLQFLLKYLYCGRVEIGKSLELYDTLNRFELPHLQQILFPVLSANVAKTTVELKQASFIWEIPILNTFSKKEVLTTTFCCDELLDWTKIKVSFDTRRSYADKDTAAFSVQTVSSQVSLYMKCKIHFGSPDLAEEYEHDFQKQNQWHIPYIFDMEKTKNEMNSLNMDTLPVFFEFKMSNGRLSSEILSTHTSRTAGNQITSNLWILQEVLCSLYKDRKHSDVTLCVGKEKLRAHKVVLTARSPVFSKMFEHQMLEKQTSQVIMEDVETKVLEAILSYLYCGELEKEPENINFAVGIYVAADRYELLKLKEKCVSYFIRVMNAENVGDLLYLADMHSDLFLKKLVQNFVYLNVDDIMNSREWNRLMKEKPDAIVEDMQNTSLAVQNLGPSILMTMLSCLYCGELDKEQKNLDSAIKLYENAERYNLPYVKSVCILFFDHEMNAENLGRLLLLANSYEDEILEIRIQDFISLNIDRILISGEWKRIIQERLDLVVDMENIVLAKDSIDASTLMSFLLFFYLRNFGMKQKSLDSLTNIYSNANKYNLRRMKQECISLFYRVVSAENIGKLLILSDEYHDHSLKQCVENFVTTNVDEILNSDDWNRILRERPDVAEDMQNIRFATQELEPTIVLTMLSYIYCGKLDKEEDDTDAVFRLYEDAKKYKLFQLTEQCISFFKRAISVENVGKILTLSEAYHEESLRQCVVTFVSSNVSKILESHKWKQLMGERLDFAKDMQRTAVAAEELGPQIVLTMLSYIYSGKLGSENTDIDAILRLYANANKHKLLQLKKECVSCLKTLLNVTNVGNTLMLAETCKDECLKTCVFDFICSNAMEVLNSDELKKFITENPGIANEILMAALASLADREKK